MQLNENETNNHLAQSIRYQEIEAKVLSLQPNAKTGFKLVLATLMACQVTTPTMLWLLLVGVPSSGKTDLVRLFKKISFVHYLDTLTQNAFISGERASETQKVYDLLPLLDDKCLIVKDWTSIFSLDEKMTKKLLGDLVNIYDAEFTKFSSRRGNVSYASSFSQLGCITPATLNKHTQYMNMVGPRFLFYFMPNSTASQRDESFESILSGKDRSGAINEAQNAVEAYVEELLIRPFEIKPLDRSIGHYLRLASELLSHCRGIVILQSGTFQDQNKGDVKYYEPIETQIEEPWRALQQLIALAQLLAYVVGKDEIGVEELAIIKEVIISSMPADRSQALRIIIASNGVSTAKSLSNAFERSPKTSRRLLEELSSLKVLEKIQGVGSVANDYIVASQFKDFLLLDPAEFLSQKLRETETPQGLTHEAKSPKSSHG